MRNKLGKRVLTMVLAMVLTFASCVTVFAQMGTDGDYFVETTKYYTVYKGTTNDAGQPNVYVSMGATFNDAQEEADFKTNYNSAIKEVLAKDYFTNQSTISTYSFWGSISKENLAAMVTKQAKLRMNTTTEHSSTWAYTLKVTNADADYDGTVVYEDTAAVTNKLTAAGYKGFSMQFHTKGTGRLPGATSFGVDDNEPKTVLAKDETKYENGDAYLYYYDAATDSFVLVDEARYLSYDGGRWSANDFWTKNAKATKHGAYVFTTEKIADSAVKKVDASLSTDTKFSTKDYVGKSMEVTTKNGEWSFPNVTAAADFDPSFEVGKKIEDVSKKLSTVTLPDTLKYITLDFAFSGELPGTANVTVSLASAGFTEGTTVYLYYYNPTKNIFELVDDAAYKDGTATFTMTHCSEYIVTSEKLQKELTEEEQKDPEKPNGTTPANPEKPNGTTPANPEKPNGTTPANPGASNPAGTANASAAVAPKTGDTTNVITFVLVLVCGCTVIGFAAARRKAK